MNDKTRSNVAFVSIMGIFQATRLDLRCDFWLFWKYSAIPGMLLHKHISLIEWGGCAVISASTIISIISQDRYK